MGIFCRRATTLGNFIEIFFRCYSTSSWAGTGVARQSRIRATGNSEKALPPAGDRHAIQLFILTSWASTDGDPAQLRSLFGTSNIGECGHMGKTICRIVLYDDNFSTWPVGQPRSSQYGGYELPLRAHLALVFDFGYHAPSRTNLRTPFFGCGQQRSRAGGSACGSSTRSSLSFCVCSVMTSQVVQYTEPRAGAPYYYLSM